MSERKMAWIVKIDQVEKHPNADSLDIATVGGWRCVTKLGEYQPGDLAVYVSIDAWIPHALAPFLSKGNEPRLYNDVAGERVRTIKLRGQVSQGLLLGGTICPTGLMVHRSDSMAHIFQEGNDVTEWLGIQKWEAPVPAHLAGIALGPFPSQCPKTDEERIQNLKNEWQHLRTLTYEVTEKLEGSSMTVGMINGDFVVCSRNLSLKETEDNTMWQVARRYEMEHQMRDQGLDNLVFQGEIIGEGIQQNHYNIRGQDWYVFAIYDITAARYLDSQERITLCQQFGIKHVPVIDTAFRFDATATQGDVVAMADGSSLLNAAKGREGLVFKQVQHPTDQLHWKAISNAYLIKTSS